MNNLQPTVCKKMVQVHLLYDLHFLPGKLSSCFVPMVDYVVVHDKTNALRPVFLDIWRLKCINMTLTFDFEDHNMHFIP